MKRFHRVFIVVIVCVFWIAMSAEETDETNISDNIERHGCLGPAIPYVEDEGWWRSPVDGVNSENYQWNEYGLRYNVLYLDSYYRENGNNISTIPGIHPGVDIDINEWNDVFPIHNGVVIQADNSDSTDWGNFIIMRHDNILSYNGYSRISIYSVYAHLVEVLVTNGQVIDYEYSDWVNPIAYGGTTGNSTGPHLHFQIDRNPPQGFGAWWPTDDNIPSGRIPNYFIAQSAEQQEYIIENTWDPMMTIYYEETTPGNVHPNFSGRNANEYYRLPQLSHAGGLYSNVVYLELTSDYNDSIIRYTTNGLDPSMTYGNIYNNVPVVISNNVVIKAIAYDLRGRQSNIRSENFIIQLPPPPLSDRIDNSGFEESISGNAYPSSWIAHYESQTPSPTFYKHEMEGKSGVLDFTAQRGIGIGVKQEYIEARILKPDMKLRIQFKIDEAYLVGDGHLGIEAPVVLKLDFRNDEGANKTFLRYYNYEHGLDSANRNTFELVERSVWIQKQYSLNDMGVNDKYKLKSVHVFSLGWYREAFVDYITLK